MEARSVGLDAALDELAVFGQDADLAGVLVDVDSNILHGWPHSFCGYSPRVVVGVIMSPQEWRPAASSNSFMWCNILSEAQLTCFHISTRSLYSAHR